MKKFLIVFVGLLLIVAGCSNLSGGESGDNASSGGSESVDEVVIGSLHPLSGGLAKEGQEMRDAVRLAVEEVNENGGIESLGGAKVVLEEADHEGVAEKGVSEVQRLDREGVVGIIGTYTSGVALSATQEAERAQIPFMIDIATADEVTERNFQYTFRTQPMASTMAENFLIYLQELNRKYDADLKTAVLVHEDSVFGSGIASFIEENAEEYGLEILANLPHSASTADLSSTVNKINSLKPDLVIPTTYLRDGTLLIEGLHQSNYKPKAIIGVANGAFSNDQFIQEKTDINQHIMDVNYAINPTSEKAKEVQASYQEKFGKSMSPNAAYSYTVTKILIDAIERAGSTDRTTIMEALRETNYTDHILALGPIVFDETGQNENARAVVTQIFDGESKVVLPDEFKNEDAVYPMN